MSDIDNGGPAFPREDYQANGNNGRLGQEGMTLRDYFAAKDPSVPDDFAWADDETDLYQRLVRWNYFYADAMIKARKA